MSTNNRLLKAIEDISTRIAGPRQPIVRYEKKSNQLNPPKMERSVTQIEKPPDGARIEGDRVPSYYVKERRSFRELADIKPSIFTVKSAAGLYSWYTSDGVVFASVNGLAEAAVGQGYYTATDDEAGNKTSEKRAKELVDEFGKEQNLDILNPNICKNMLIAGFCFVETRMNKFPSKCALQIIHPKIVKKISVDGKDGSINYIMVDNPKAGAKDIKIEGKYLTLFVHNQIANDVTGTSIITPVESLLTTKRTAITNIDKIIEKRMFPDIIWKTTRDPAGLKEILGQKEVDEDLVLGWLEPDELKDVAQIVEIQGNTRYEGYIAHIDTLIYKGLYAPDLYFWKDATLASAKELTTMVDRNINAIQRNIARGMEAGFFKRLLELNKLGEVDVKVMWGVERTGAEDLQMENIIAVAIENGLIGPPQLTKLLKLMGLNIGELGWDVDPLLDDEDPEPDEEEEEEEPEEEPEEET